MSPELDKARHSTQRSTLDITRQEQSVQTVKNGPDMLDSTTRHTRQMCQVDSLDTVLDSPRQSSTVPDSSRQSLTVLDTSTELDSQSSKPGIKAYKALCHTLCFMIWLSNSSHFIYHLSYDKDNTASHNTMYINPTARQHSTALDRTRQHPDSSTARQLDSSRQLDRMHT